MRNNIGVTSSQKGNQRADGISIHALQSLTPISRKGEKPLPAAFGEEPCQWGSTGQPELAAMESVLSRPHGSLKVVRNLDLERCQLAGVSFAQPCANPRQRRHDTPSPAPPPRLHSSPPASKPALSRAQARRQQCGVEGKPSMSSQTQQLHWPRRRHPRRASRRRKRAEDV